MNKGFIIQYQVEIIHHCWGPFSTGDTGYADNWRKYKLEPETANRYHVPRIGCPSHASSMVGSHGTGQSFVHFGWVC